MLVVFGLPDRGLEPRQHAQGLRVRRIGVLLSLIGFSPVHGVLRFNFGSDNYLWDGIPLVPFFIGLFAIAELVNHVLRGDTIAEGGERIRVGLFGAFKGFWEVFQYKTTLVRSSAIGILAGIIPGIGGVLANFLSYSWPVSSPRTRRSRHGTPRHHRLRGLQRRIGRGALLPPSSSASRQRRMAVLWAPSSSTGPARFLLQSASTWTSCSC